MLDDTPCPKCGGIITNDDALNVSLEDAIAYADVTMFCPHCKTHLKVEVEIQWSFTVCDSSTSTKIEGGSQ